MVTLYKRSNETQRKLLRAIEGAVRDAAQAHPENAITKNFPRSVAKRAVGTLTALGPEVLAAVLEPASVKPKREANTR